MTCGTVEENLDEQPRRRSTRSPRRATTSTSHEIRDAHNWIAWRDSFDPHLLDAARSGCGRETVATLALDGRRRARVRALGPAACSRSRPSRASAGDYEDRGMVDAIAPLLEAGRVKLYCVDSYDAGQLARRRAAARGARAAARRTTRSGSSSTSSR